MVTIHDLDRYAITHITLHLREQDASEIYGLRPHDCPLRLAYEAHYMLSRHGRGKVAWFRGVPAAVIGFYERWPGCWEAVSFGTERYKDVGVALMREGRKLARGILDDLGANRLQADSRIDNVQAHAFIRALGGKPEGPPLEKYGKDGATYQRFVWFGDVQGKQLMETA